jgi:hypothetical protein
VTVMCWCGCEYIVERTVRFVGEFYTGLITWYLFADNSALHNRVSINFFLTALSGDAWSTMHSYVCLCVLIVPCV